MGEIYKITNKVNGKIYIGQTIRTTAIRFQGHISCSRNKQNACKCVIDRAIAKYSPENFIVETLEKCDNNLLNERERYWVSYFNSYNHEIGYNMTMGGDGVQTTDYQKIVDAYNSGLCIKEICDKYGCSNSTVNHILITESVYDAEEVKKRGIHCAQATRGVAVAQYNINGEWVENYSSAQEASRQVDKVTAIRILESCKTRSGLHGGYQWRYASDSPPGKYIGRPVRHHSVDQYDIDGNYLKTFFAIAEAERETGVRASHISRCCSQKTFHTQGYIWKFTDDCRDIKEWTDRLYMQNHKMAKVNQGGNM